MLKKLSISSGIPLCEKQKTSTGKKLETLNNFFSFFSSTVGKSPPAPKMIRIQCEYKEVWVKHCHFTLLMPESVCLEKAKYCIFCIYINVKLVFELYKSDMCHDHMMALFVLIFIYIF